MRHIGKQTYQQKRKYINTIVQQNTTLYKDFARLANIPFCSEISHPPVKVGCPLEIARSNWAGNSMPATRYRTCLFVT